MVQGKQQSANMVHGTGQAAVGECKRWGLENGRGAQRWVYRRACAEFTSSARVRSVGVHTVGGKSAGPCDVASTLTKVTFSTHN